MLKEKITEPENEDLGVARKAEQSLFSLHEMSNKEIPSKKISIDQHLIDTMREFVQKRLPNIDTTDENVLKALFISELNQFVAEMEKSKKEGEEIFASIKDDPRMATLFQEMLNGTPIKEALAKAELQEYMLTQEDDYFQEYQDRLLEKQVNDPQQDNEHRQAKNRNKENFVNFVCENCNDEDLIHQFIDFVTQLATKIINKDLDKEIIATLWKSFVFDREIKANFERGALEGRNQKIEKHLDSRTNRDGICSPSSPNSSSVKAMGYIEKLLNN